LHCLELKQKVQLGFVMARLIGGKLYSFNCFINETFKKKKFKSSFQNENLLF